MLTNEDKDMEKEFANEIFNIQFNAKQGMLNEKFNEYSRDDDSLRYISKEEFLHDETDCDEDGLKFNYRYVINGDAYCDRGKIHRFYNLYLVVCPKSLCKEKLEDVLDCCGISADEANCCDVVDYGILVPMGDVEFEFDEDNDEGWNDEVLNNIANVFETINGLRGFYLDKPMNRLGNTGWDLLYEAVRGKDLFESVKERYGM